MTLPRTNLNQVLPYVKVSGSFTSSLALNQLYIPISYNFPGTSFLNLPFFTNTHTHYASLTRVCVSTRPYSHTFCSLLLPFRICLMGSWTHPWRSSSATSPRKLSVKLTVPHFISKAPPLCLSLGWKLPEETNCYFSCVYQTLNTCQISELVPFSVSVTRTPSHSLPVQSVKCMNNFNLTLITKSKEYHSHFLCIMFLLIFFYVSGGKRVCAGEIITTETSKCLKNLYT